MMNYQKDDQSFTTTKEILEDYQNNCPEMENFDFKVNELRADFEGSLP